MDRRLLALCAIAATDTIGYGVILPLVPFYAAEFHASPLTVTAVIATYPLSQAFTAPSIGRMSDRIGRQTVIILGLAAALIGYLAFAAAISLAWIIVSRMLLGIAGANYSVLEAYVADITTKEARTDGMGWIGAAYGIGIVLGPAIGSLSLHFGSSAPGYVAAGVCALNILLVLVLLPEPAREREAIDLHPQQTWSSLIRACSTPPLSTIALTSFLTSSTFAAIMAVLALHLQRKAGLSSEGAGWLWTLAGAVMVVARSALVGRLSKAIGDYRLIQVGFLLLICSFLGFTASTTYFEACMSTILLCLGTSFVFPPLTSLVSKAVNDSSQGAVFGSMQMLGNFASIAGPLAAGIAFEAFDSSAPFWIGTGILVSAALVFGLGMRPQESPTRPLPHREDYRA